MTVSMFLMSWMVVSIVTSLLMGRFLATRDAVERFVRHPFVPTSPADAHRALVSR